MSRFTLPPGARTLGARMASDNTVYRPDSRGSIEVDNPRHVRELKGSGAAKRDMVHETVRPVGELMPDRYCAKCLMNNVSWVTKCARCGAPLQSKKTEN